MNGKYYTPYFCEENIWKCSHCIKEELFSRYKVLFLSNRANSIALLQQKAAPVGEFIIWDYHVILHDTITQTIFDFDSRLGFESNFKKYFDLTFGNQNTIPEKFRTCIRAISFQNYIDHFDSDRRHMMQNGKQLQPFPEWPLIRSNEPLTLKNLLDFNWEKYIIKTTSTEEYTSSFF